MTVLTRICTAVFIFLIATQFANAECNFKTSNYIQELGTPSSIMSISIVVPKNAKYQKNSYKIITSRPRVIPDRLKKFFAARVEVNYPFGKCTYKAKVRQNGDLKDHIKLMPGGEISRSLLVKLKDGNILNAVHFKLLIPETRNNLNEVLGTIVIRELGFLVPETFQVRVDVNGTKSLMLFQEVARKELVERNMRREGPIFEGDEKILWSLGNFKFASLSMAKLVNRNWFLKGLSSQDITISSFASLQNSYLQAIYNNEQYEFTDTAPYLFLPNKRMSKTFQDYAFLLLSLNGAHGLYGNNRKYYFNSIKNEFEPIYYDGDLRFEKILGRNLTDGLVKASLPDGLNLHFLQKISDLPTEKLLAAFDMRTVLSNEETAKYFNAAISIWLENVNFLKLRFAMDDNKSFKFQDHGLLLREYTERQLVLGLEQNVIVRLERIEGDYRAYLSNGEQINLSIDEISSIIKDNNLNNIRYVLLINPGEMEKSRFDLQVNFDRFPGKIKSSDGILVQIDQSHKTLFIKQEDPLAWVLILDADLEGWSIAFSGADPEQFGRQNPTQRFNSLGLTGCLNIYNSNFKDTSIDASGGGCEDTINIISSVGSIEKISVRNATQDGIDLDFSSLKFGAVFVKGAGNDCFDVSGGTYFVENLVGEECGDKGVSVGEQSIFEANTVSIDDALIGIASKDFSSVTVTNAKLSDVSICFEVAQKKQEFGGGNLTIQTLDCLGEKLIDDHSSATLGNQ